jgi:hypothetical protein
VGLVVLLANHRWLSNLRSGEPPAVPPPAPPTPPPMFPELALTKEALILDAEREWSNGTKSRREQGAARNDTSCSELLRRHGLCRPALLRVPEAHEREHTRKRPFVYLHLSKCAGTSLLSELQPLGWQYFSLFLPKFASGASACGASAKCCYWRERLDKLSAEGSHVGVLTQEPANVAPSVRARRPPRAPSIGRACRALMAGALCGMHRWTATACWRLSPASTRPPICATSLRTSLCCAHPLSALIHT